MIEFTNVTKYYAKQGSPALDQVSLRIDDRDIVGVIGHNGAGKTTLFLLANGLTRISKGDIFLNGFSIREQGGCCAFLRVKAEPSKPESHAFWKAVALRLLRFGAISGTGFPGMRPKQVSWKSSIYFWMNERDSNN